MLIWASSRSVVVRSWVITRVKDGVMLDLNTEFSKSVLLILGMTVKSDPINIDTSCWVLAHTKIVTWTGVVISLNLTKKIVI